MGGRLTPQAIATALQNQLKTDANLLAHPVKEVFIGARVDVPRENFPFLVIEWKQDIEREAYIGDNSVCDMAFVVHGFIYDEDMDDMMNKQLNLLNAVKKAICADVTLGGACEFVSIGVAENVMDLFPVRGFSLNINAKYKQNFINRT